MVRAPVTKLPLPNVNEDEGKEMPWNVVVPAITLLVHRMELAVTVVNCSGPLKDDPSIESWAMPERLTRVNVPAEVTPVRATFFVETTAFCSDMVDVASSVTVETVTTPPSGVTWLNVSEEPARATVLTVNEPDTPKLRNCQVEPLVIVRPVTVKVLVIDPWE